MTTDDSTPPAASQSNRRALVHNAITNALSDAGDWVPLSVRIAATRAALAEVDAWHEAERPAVPSAVVAPPTDQTTPSHRAGLREQIAGALIAWTYRGKEPDPETGILETVRANAYSRADAVLVVLSREWPWLRAEAEDAKPPAEAADRDRIAEETALSLGRDLLRDGLDAFLLRLVGPDNARRVLAEHRAADRAADAPATECSAQHRQFDDGRLCIRAAQHHGDHIDERGYHWSDTVAVYPVADGTFASRIRRDVGTMQRRMADETATETPEPHRGDAFEQWLKARRDEWAPEGCQPWQILDQTLEEYRLHADTGTPLGEHVCEAKIVGDCECLEQPAAGARQADETASTRCTECGHPKSMHGEGEDPVTPGRCTACPDDDAWHDYQPTAGARQDGSAS